MTENKVIFDVVKVYDRYCSYSQIQKDTDDFLIDIVVPSDKDTTKLLGLKRAKQKAKATCSLDQNQRIFITEKAREQLFNKRKNVQRTS